MNDTTTPDKDQIANYLLEEGKRRIAGAGIKVVDHYAKLLCDMLHDLDADKAHKLYTYYQEKA